MRTQKPMRWLAVVLTIAMVIGLLPMIAFASGSVYDYQAFISALKVLEGYADTYASNNPSEDANELVINFIRTGVDRYNDGNWVTLAGEEITGFTTYVEEQDAANGTNAMDLRDIVIDDFKLPNGNLVDFGHMFGTMNIAYVAAVASADLGGWAGDLCDLILYSKDYGNVPAGTVEEMADYIRINCFGVNADDAFGMDDFYGDMDAYYLIAELKAGSSKLSTIMEGYFTAELSDADRAAYFLNNRFNGLETQEDVRSAILGTYTANTGLKVLEADRGLSDYTDLRTASCYAFADYLFELAGDRLEGDTGEGGESGETPYYSVFSSTESVLAPGIVQTINYATTADNKQIVYYVATVDVTRDDVTIMANYKDNNPGGGWGMQRVEDQANALLNNYKDTNENFNVIVATNADGYNMSTGQPGGLLVMDGVEWHPVDGDGFFAILKDGSAMIGTKAEYETYKDQIQEAVGGFGATLVKDGVMAVNKSSTYYTSRASRTAIGITAEGKVVMMVLDGRQEPFSAGGSMEEIAQIMLDAGCVHAVNLDGGGSTTYLSKPEGSDSLQLVNRPSDGYARSVATSLVAISTAKSSKEFDHANITSDYDYLTIGTSLTMTATGVSNTGNAAPIPENAVWQVSDSTIGSITADGVFTAIENGEVEVQLVVDGTVVGSKTLNVVVPDAIAFEKEVITAIYGVSAEMPLKLTYNGTNVAFNNNDFAMLLEFEDAGMIEGTTVVIDEATGYRNVMIAAVVVANQELFTFATINLYKADEAYFDFDNATAGNRTLAWLREVNNAKTEDNMIYQITTPGEDMGIDYTFALDMTTIEIPAQLADLTYMLPGADTGSTAWDFLLQLAERVSVLTEVRISVQLDADLDVDTSELKVSNDYFYFKNAELDENNLLTIVCGWHDQTAAIDPATANPICILSGLKAVPKADAAWDADNQLVIKNTGNVSYKIYLRASSLYSFASKPENQAEYGLQPYSSEEVQYNGGPEQGAYFGTTYADFEDTFILDRTNRQGWYEIDSELYYFVDNVPVTGLQYVPSYENASTKLYYNFTENGVCMGVYTGSIEKDGKLLYALGGVLQKGWQSVADTDGQSYYYYFDPYTYAAVGAGEGWIEVEHYNYYFVDYKCMKGEIVKTSSGYRYRFAGNWQRNQWVEYQGGWYYLGQYYDALVDGLHWVRTVEGSSSACYLFGEDAVWQQDVSGLYHVGDDTYLIENGVRQEEPGLVYIDGYYYYFGANAKAVKNRTYWPTKTNDLMPMGPYQFDEQGRMVNPPVTEPEDPDTPVEPDTPDTPVDPEVKNGVVEVNGALYYYENDVIQYAAGLIQLEDGNYIYVRSNGQLAIGNYWVTNHNGVLPLDMYTFGADGMMVVETEEPDDGESGGTTEPETPVEPEVKDGIVSVNGILYYYDNGSIAYCAGLVQLEDGSYIYVRSNGMLAIGNYWITNHHDLLPVGTYNFGADGKMTNPPATEEPDDGESGGTTEPEIPVEPEVKNGIVEVNGKLYYYKNDVIQYGAGVVKMTDEAGATFYIYVRSSGQLATGSYWPTTTNGEIPGDRSYNWGTDGRLYL